MENARKLKNAQAKNGKNSEPEVLPEGALLATMEDFADLIKANPELQIPLTNIVQKRMLAEKDAEIARLKELIPTEPEPLAGKGK